MNDRPLLLLCDPEGRVFEHPSLRSMGRSGPHIIEVDEWIPLPEGSKLFSLPGRIALGWDEDGQRLQRVPDIRDRSRNFAPTPVAGFLPPGFVRTHLPAAEILPDAPILPTWAYACVAWYQDQFVAAAYRIDANEKWQPDQYDDRDLLPRIQELSAEFPQNRLLSHLTRCATHYHCFAAKNLFFGRWEAPLPVAPTCNADCLGCLSWQPDDSHPSSHDRIRFRPTVEEVCQIAVHHLETAPDPIVSFGQGCEGEPLIEHKLIGEAIRAMRQKTGRGTIHLNTNGSLPTELEQLVTHGLDSVRISLNSLMPERYEAYFRPKQYSSSDVKRSAEIVRKAGAYLHINLLGFPGLSDQQREIDLLLECIETIGIDRIQLKNLCIDPDMYVRAMPGLDERGRGMRHLRDTLRNCAPQVSLGYFNIPKEEFAFPCDRVRSEVVSRVGETP